MHYRSLYLFQYLLISIFGLFGLVQEGIAQLDHRFETGRSFTAKEADQAVAVDNSHIYAIDNKAIGKYNKRTGKKVDQWVGAEDGPFIHLNSGVVIGDTLFAAHSNFPGVPMTSSIEMWSVDNMQHIGSHSFGIYKGSATWIDRHKEAWWVAFAHYDRKDGGVPGKGPEWSVLVRFDVDWQPQGSYVFPSEVIERFHPNSNSGGAWGPDNRLYVTGHDAGEVYILELPKAGSTLKLIDILSFPGEGQGIAWDPSNPNILYGIRRDASEVVTAKLIKVKDK